MRVDDGETESGDMTATGVFHREAKQVDENIPSDTCLVVVHGIQIGEIMPLRKDRIIVGRSADCDIQIMGRGTSRRHCRIRSCADGYRIEDLGATNGTWVNSKAVRSAQLRDGDLLRLGDVVLKFIGGWNIEARYHAELHEELTRDHLTKLNNRRHFQSILKAQVQQVLRYDKALSLILFDIDRFKDLNDTFGHQAGDSVLYQLARVVQARVREADTLARIGGEEFAVVLPECNLDEAVRVSEAYRTLIQGFPFSAEGQSVNITVSLGVAAWDEDMADPADLISLADQRLYEAKEKGRNQVVSG